ncbi:MAG: hypothetical protein RR355_00025 [Oscillospiraceae bacterium]
MDKIINVNSNEVSAEYQTAIKLHAQIMASGELAANALYDVCKSLKQMRDEKLYEELGYETFDTYCEKMAGIKARQAYTYISTFERLGNTLLQSNAKFGITKLDLIAGINPIERNEMLDNGKFDNMSTAELKELVKKCKEQGEQISLLSDELEDTKSKSVDETQNLQKEIENLKQKSDSEDYDDLLNKIDELKSQLDKKENGADELPENLSEAEKEKIRKEINAEFELSKKQAFEEVLKKSETENEKKIKNAIKAAKQEENEKINEKIKILEESAALAESRAIKLQKELQLSDNNSATASVYFNSMQDNFNKLFETIEQMPIEKKNKFKGACLKLFNALIKKVEE